MLNRKEVFENIKPVLQGFASKNAKTAKCYFIDGYPVGDNIMGYSVDPHPFEGKVLSIIEQVVIVKYKPNYFYLLDKSLMDNIPAINAKVEVTPYYRKEFNGQRMGEPVENNTQFMDGEFLPKGSCILTNDTVRIPGQAVNNSALHNLVVCLQQQKLSDGYRSITNLMQEAGADNFIIVDSVESDPEALLPSIKFSVCTTKFNGQVHIVHHYPSGTLSVGFYSDVTKIFENISYQDIGALLEKHIDDGLWQQIKVNVLPK